MKIFIAILKALSQIHSENLLILATLTGKDVDSDEIKKLDEQFDKIIKDI